MKRHNIQLFVVVRNFNAKVGTRNVGETATGHFRIVKRNQKGDINIELDMEKL